MERRIQQGQEEQMLLSNKVHLISFHSRGHGELFRTMLLRDVEFRPLRQALKHAGYTCLLRPSGAIVLVRPEQYILGYHQELGITRPQTQQRDHRRI